MSPTHIDPTLLEPSAQMSMQKYIEQLAQASPGLGKDIPQPIAINYSMAVSLKRIADILESLHLHFYQELNSSETSEQTSPQV